MTRTEAVILAAGRGSRLHEHTHEIPKALLPIGPRSLDDATETTFLRRSVDILHGLGVSPIVIVVGSLREMIVREVETWDVAVRVVVNTTPDIATSGSLHSFQFAVNSDADILNGTAHTLLLDADIVYHRSALDGLFDGSPGSAILVCERTAGNQEEVRVYGTAEQPRFLGKALEPALVDGEPCLGEAAGIVRFAPEDHEPARATIDWLGGDPAAPAGSPRRSGYGPARMATEHEELTQRFMRYGRIRAVLFGDDVPFMECDDASEYRTLRESFYPALLRREAAT